MALLSQTAVSYDQRVITTAYAAAINAPISAKDNTKTSTSRTDGTARGSPWGVKQPAFAVSNEGRVTSSYFSDAKELRGFVQNNTGTGIARTVIAISQLTNAVLGSTISDAVTGAFTLPLYTTNETKVTVVAIPIDSDVRNIVSYRDVVPVTKL